MVFDVRPFRSNVDNVDILNAIRNTATVEYQRRIPEATKANIDSTVQNLLDNRPLTNEFIDGLVNRIGLEIYKYNSWTNPLGKWKRRPLTFGNTIEEVVTGVLQAKVYSHDRDYLEKDIFGVEIPEVQTSFHKINREDYYKLSVKESALRRAFTSPNGLSDFVEQLMQMPATSDNLDEFLLMTSLIGEYYKNGGFFKERVADLGAIDADSADAKYALRKSREYAGKLGFLSRYYNPAGMPVFATPDELEILITPEANATLDVEGLAGAFNIDKASMAGRTTIIPKENFGVPGAQMVLTTKDFFVVADSLMTTTSVQNPVGLVTNYFLHHHQVASVSRFVPAILFTSAEDSDVIVLADTPVTSVSAVTAIDGDGNTVTDFTRGELYEVNAQAVTTPADGYNDAVRYEVTGFNSPRSRISQTGALYVAIDETATQITVTAYATDSALPQISNSATFDIVGDIAQLWPDPTILTDSDDDGLIEVTPEALVMAEGDTVTIPSVTGVQYRKEGVNVTNGSVHDITVETNFDAVARSGFELTAGTFTWTFTPTP